MESLLSLSLTLIIVLASYEFFGVSRTFFFRLKDRCEKRQAALATLDMMAGDVRRAGQGLAAPIRLGLLSGLETKAGGLHLEWSEKELDLAADVQPGQTSLAVKDGQGLKPNRRVCLVREGAGQVLEITNIQDKTLAINPAVDAFCAKEEGRLLLLETVDYYLDGQGVIRKKVNNGSGQPLLEEVGRLECASDSENRLTTIRLANRLQEEKIHETSVFPKNLASAILR
jgi:hypothetical protein